MRLTLEDVKRGGLDGLQGSGGSLGEAALAAQACGVGCTHPAGHRGRAGEARPGSPG